MGLFGIGADAAFAVGFIVLVVTLEPDHLAVTLESEHVGGDAIQEPAVMADDHGAAGEIEKRIFQCPEGVDVEIVGGLVEEEDVGASLQELGQMYSVAFTARELADLLLLVGGRGN